MSGLLASDLHPLIERLVRVHGFARLDESAHAAFVAAPGHALVLFTEDPLRFREVLDLAVIAPELVAAFPGRFRVGLLPAHAARAVAPAYRFRRWPAFVLTRDGAYVGAVDGMRNWEEYRQLFETLLEAEPSEPPPWPTAPAACH